MEDQRKFIFVCERRIFRERYSYIWCVLKRNYSVMKWSNADIVNFLDIFRNFECLWNTSHPQYCIRNAREASLKKLMQELSAAGVETANVEALKKKIKNIKDSYRMEVNKVKKSIKSGMGTDEVYTPKLAWFEQADSFWSKVVSGRESSSNLVSTDSLTILVMTTTKCCKHIFVGVIQRIS